MAVAVDILVLAHERDRPTERTDATVAMLAGHWQQSGLTVAFVRGLARAERIAASVVVNHVDLTETPHEYVAFFQDLPAVVNGRMTDISKPKVCNELVSRGDAFEGPVIVKTRRNHGGVRERKLIEKRSSPWRRVARAAAGRFRRSNSGSPAVSWGDVPWLDPHAYPVFDSLSLVPDGVWRNPDLIVQKFLTEKERDGRYCLRCWYVLGNRGFHVVTLATDPIVKGSNIVDRRVVDVETPPELIAVRAKIGMEYGRIDYVLVDGRPVVYDANRTPASSPGAVERYAPQWREMAKGIDFFRAR